MCKSPVLIIKDCFDLLFQTEVAKASIRYVAIICCGFSCDGFLKFVKF